MPQPIKPPEEPPGGYILSDQRHAEELLAVEAKLLLSEGIDPEWPGFPHEHDHPGWWRSALQTEQRSM